MNWSLRKRYYVWISGLVLFCFVLNVGIDATHDLLPESWKREDEPGEELREILFILVANIVALPLVIALGWFAVERMIRPIRDIANTAERISAGQISTRIPYPPVRDETHKLVHELNLAFDRYRAVIEQMQRFNGNAAHQLRTPLAALRTEGEVVLQRPRSDTDYQEAIKTMLERAQVMTRLVEQLLELAALDARHRHEQFSAFAPAAHVARVVESFEPMRDHKAISLELDLDSNLQIRGDPILLEQVVANILDNALRFTPEGGTISVHLQADGQGAVTFWVDDSGPGIPAEDRQAVFERFEQGLRPDTAHSGLGLAIVAEIARVHGGAAHASATASGGARIGVTFPRINPAT